MSFPGVFEMAPGADPDADPETYTWVDLSARTQRNDMVINRGRRSGSASFSEPAQATVPLSASTSDAQTDSLVAYQARSQWYPYIRKGLVCRYHFDAGATWLRLGGATGDRIATADKASLDITSDIYVAVQFRCPIVFPAPDASNIQLFGKHNAGGNQRSWLIEMTHHGHPTWFWSTTGANFFSLTGAAPLPRPDLGDLSLGLYFDVDNGAGGRTLYVWAYRGTIPEMNAALTANEARWRLGAPRTESGATTIFNSNAPLEAGDISNSAGTPYPGGINALEVRAGDWTGAVRANPDFTLAAPGAASLVDTASTANTWTPAGNAEFTNRKIRLIGELGSNQLTLPGHGVTGTGRVTWSINGLLRRLRSTDPPLDSALYSRIMAPENVAYVKGYWPMEDGRDAASFFTPLAAGRRITTLSGFSFAADSSLPASKPLPTVSGDQPFGFDVTVPTSTNDTWEVTYLLKIEDPAATSRAVLVIGATGTAREWQLLVSDAQVTVAAFDAGGGGLELSTGISWVSDLEYWSLVTLSVDQNGGNIDWRLDWVPIEGPLSGISFIDVGSFAATAGRVRRLANLALAPTSGLSMGHLILTSGTTVGWLAQADQAHAGEAAAARVARLCRQHGIPVLVDGAYTQAATGGTNAGNAAAGEVRMGPQPVTTLMGALDECAAIGGLLGEATETLALTFRSAWTMNNQTPRLTSAMAPVQPFSAVDDDRDTVNDATVSQPDGGSGRFVDTGHQTLEGPYRDSRTLNAYAGWQLDGLAEALVHQGTVEEIRFPGLAFSLSRDSAIMDDWLAARGGDLVVPAELPAVLPEETSDQLLDGFTETIEPGDYGVVLNSSPAQARRVHVVDDPVFGKIDSAGSELDASFVAGTDTSMDVAVTLGPGWNTDAGEVPFYVETGGCKVQVTAVGALAGGVQTFTVSATIANGVNKTVPAGTAVRLWRAAVVAP